MNKTKNNLILIAFLGIFACSTPKTKSQAFSIDLLLYEKYILTKLTYKEFNRRLSIYEKINHNAPDSVVMLYYADESLLLKVEDELAFNDFHSVVAWINENPDSTWLKDVTIGLLVEKDSKKVIFFEVFLDGKNNDFITGARDHGECFEVELYNTYNTSLGKYTILNSCKVEPNFEKFLTHRKFNYKSIMNYIKNP